MNYQIELASKHGSRVLIKKLFNKLHQYHCDWESDGKSAIHNGGSKGR